VASKKLSILVLAAAVGCSTSAIQDDIPALLTNPGPDTHREIEQSISAALDGVDIAIAEDALTRNSTLTIERGMKRSIARSPEMGRDLGRPEHFQLVIDGPQCVLVHASTGLHWILKSSECVAE
jgi:hypothetical protein